MKKITLFILLLPCLSYGQVITTMPSASSFVPTMSTPTDVVRDRAGNIFISDFNSNTVKKRSPSGVVTIIGGTGIIGFSGDGGPATAADINGPTSVALDSIGNVYFTDQFNSRVRVIDTSGTITTFAGSAMAGYAGDGGPATAAKLSFPVALVFDTAYNLYIADDGNNVIRKVNRARVISTYAGTGAVGYSGDGGPATAAEFNATTGLVLDASGRLYVDDGGNNVVRVISPAGIVTTFAGNSTAGRTGDGGPATAAELNVPQLGLALDSAGDLYIGDVGNDIIRMVSPAGIISTIGGTGIPGTLGDGGPAKYAQIGSTLGMYTDHAGNLIFADGNNNSIRKISGITGQTYLCLGDTSVLQVHNAHGAWFTSNSLVAPLIEPGMVKGLSAGTATVYYADGGDTAFVPILVTSSPTAGTISGADSICLAVSNDTLSDPVIGGYWWTSDTASINLFGTLAVGLAGGIDTVHYSVPYSCGTFTTSFVFTVVDADPCCITGPDSVCKGDTVQLEHVGLAGGTWGLYDATMAEIVGPGEVVGIVAGEEFVSYTINGGLPGCGGPSVFTLNIVNCANEAVPAANAPVSGIDLFPNPATAELNLSSGEIINDVVITDCFGRDVYRASFASDHVRINISGLPPGVYVARINGDTTKRFVKE